MTVTDDIAKETKKLKDRVAALRAKLPGADMPDPDNWYTIDQAAERLGVTAREAGQMLAKMDTRSDGRGRTVISKANFDSFVVVRAAGGESTNYL